MPRRDPIDPKTLIADSLSMPGISVEECRSVFLDWALSLAPSQTPETAIRVLLERHAGAPPSHPMMGVLREGLAEPSTRGRRGGRAARTGEADP